MKGATSRLLWNSVKSKLVLLVAISYTAFISMLIYNSVQNISLAWEKFSELNENIMALHSHNLDVMLAANNEYLIALSPTAYEFGQEEADNFEVSTSSMEYLRPRIYLIEEMKNAIGQGVLIDGLFFYFPDTGEFLTSFSSNTNYLQRGKIKDDLILCVEEHAYGTNRWLLRKSAGEAFLCHILKMGEGYLGMWVATDTLLENLGEAESAQIDYIAFLSDSSEILDNRPFFQDSSRLDVEKDRITLSRRHYVITQSHTQSGTFSLIGLVDEQKVLNSFNTLYYTILFFSLILLGLMVTFLILLHKSILAPLQSLAETIKSIRQGNFQAAVNPQNFDQEFREVLETFNAMTGEIEKLKLTVYEEKIQRIRTKQQYYQLQIKPHFLTNCLNMIYQFAQIQNYDLIQKMSLYLSTYFRYTLKNESPFVSLGEELNHVKNYLKIQKIRYPYHLEVTVTSSADLDCIQIPPFTIQPFVENAVKYAVNMDSVTHLQVLAEKEELPSGPNLVIHISDDGPGFSPEVLCALQKGKSLENDLSGPAIRQRIGILNVQQRFLLFYEDSAQIRFYNTHPHGATVELSIPLDNNGGMPC